MAKTARFREYGYYGHVYVVLSMVSSFKEISSNSSSGTRIFLMDGSHVDVDNAPHEVERAIESMEA